MTRHIRREDALHGMDTIRNCSYLHGLYGMLLLMMRLEGCSARSPTSKVRRHLVSCNLGTLEGPSPTPGTVTDFPV